MMILDATMSREPTWDAAMAIQSEMFDVAAARDGLEVELVFFRGFHECRASGWVSDARALQSKMTAVSCLAGRTQIGRALNHVLKRAEDGRGWILRVYESQGGRCDATVKTSLPFKSVTECNLVEEDKAKIRAKRRSPARAREPPLTT